MTTALVILACVSAAGQPLQCHALGPTVYADDKACFDAGAQYVRDLMGKWPNRYVHFECLRA